MCIYLIGNVYCSFCLRNFACWILDDNSNCLILFKFASYVTHMKSLDLFYKTCYLSLIQDYSAEQCSYITEGMKYFHVLLRDGMSLISWYLLNEFFMIPGIIAVIIICCYHVLLAVEQIYVLKLNAHFYLIPCRLEMQETW